MQVYETLKHTTWECKYHVVFIAKYRKKVLYGQVRRELVRQKEGDVIEGLLMVDHVHITPKTSKVFCILAPLSFS